MRKYISILVISVLIGASAYAQDIKKTGGFARLTAMGSNPYIIDPYYETLNPAWAGVYDDFVFGDIGSSNGPFAAGGFGEYIAGNFNIGNNITLGAILTRNDFNGFSISRLDPLTNNTLLPTSFQNSLLGGVVSIVNNVRAGSVTPLDNNIELLGTLTFGKNTLGLGVAYASTTNETSIIGTISPGVDSILGKNEGSAKQFGINVGLLSEFTGNLKLDFAGAIVFPSATYDNTQSNASFNTTKNIEASQTVISLMARLFWKFSSKITFVPAANFVTISGTRDVRVSRFLPPPTQSLPDTTISSDLASVTIITGGFGFNYAVGDFLIAGGPSFTAASVTFPKGTNERSPELTQSFFAFPVWNLGLEWNLTDWLVGRFGYVAVTYSTNNENSVQGTDKAFISETVQTLFLPSQRGATLGVGFRFGDFSLDATVNEDVLRQGLNNIGGGGSVAGASNNGATFAYLSLAYAMP